MYLIGAGPGDPGLITVRGREALMRAEVVLYDRLGTEALMDLVRETGLAALIATHNPELAARMDRTVRLEDGRLL